MSPERLALPRGWFVAVALVALALAGGAAFALLQPFASAPPISAQSGTPPEGPPPQQTSPSPAAPHVLRLPTPRQLDGEGRVIPWGDVAPGNAVRLELEGVDRDGFVSAEFFLAKDDDAAQPAGQGFAAPLRGLAPGRYRWSVLLGRRDGGPPVSVEPPGGDGRAVDFIVVPPAPVLQRLAQSQLDGKPMPADRRSSNGARLEVELQVPYPGAIVEFEVKSAAVAFDGNGVHRVAANDGRAALSFTGVEGRYRWRARATAGARPPTAWLRQVDSRDVDFVVIVPPAATPPITSPSSQTPPQTRPPSQQQPNPRANPLARPPAEISRSGAGSGGIGSGHNEPLKSEQINQTSFWQVAFMRILIGLGTVAAILGLLLGGVRGLRALIRRK